MKVDALAGELRTRILDGDLPAGAPLREHALSDQYGLARHTVRAALRALAAEGIVRVERNRGARVTTLDVAAIEGLGELRVALEVEAARLALERHGRLPAVVHDAQRALEAACAAEAGFAAVAGAHERLHAAVVAASGSERITAAHHALAGELRLFLAQLRPAWDVGNLAAEHAALLRDVDAHGPEALRAHIAASTRALTSALKVSAPAADHQP